VADLVLKARQDRRVRHGHLWVYSNEVDVKRTPLDAFRPGDEVNVLSHNGEFLARATVNPNTLVCARVYGRKPDQPLNTTLLQARIQQALTVRETAFDTPHYRLVHGEGDLLPGLVVDRFGEHVVVQLGTAGLERVRDDLLAALENTLSPAGILFRNDSRARDMEGLTEEVVVASGDVPDRVEVVEGGLRFAVDPHRGQKTGWFYDQRPNRQALRQWVRGKRVLDLFSYVGAWSLAAAHGGATEVVAVDSSASAMASLSENAQINQLAVDARTGDALAVLKQLRESGEQFDVVVLDPPALIKRRKDHRAGLKHYHALNQNAVRVLAPGGVLVSCSCSHHLADSELASVVEQAAHRRGCVAQTVSRGDQGPDHPVHPAMVETRYLKTLTSRLTSF